MSEESKKGKPESISIFKFNDEIYIEKDSRNYILNTPGHTWFYTDKINVFKDLNDYLLNEKIKNVPDDLKYNITYLIDLMKKHHSEMKELLKDV